jgi:RNA polymerase sigma-70 factor (ECF subfamily)
MEEQEAIVRLQRGDIGGLALLVRQYQVRAVRAAYLVTHDLALAEDVVQAAFLKAYERIDQFDARRPFGPWFLTSVLNDAKKATARHARIVPFGGDDNGDVRPDQFALADDRPGPEALWERAETADELWAALKQLTPKERAAVVARYYLGLSEAEMATTLDCTTGTVKWRLHAARERLRRILGPRMIELESVNGRADQDSADEPDRGKRGLRSLGPLAGDPGATRSGSQSTVG